MKLQKKTKAKKKKFKKRTKLKKRKRFHLARSVFPLLVFVQHY